MNEKCNLSMTATAILLLLVFCKASISIATEEYAEVTGRDCATCHIDPLGGGDLTEYGKGYMLSVNPLSMEAISSASSISSIIRLTAGFIHIITAFMWLGTILYVHLVLKPAYASQGLPRSEVKVGLISMAVMAITGTVLTYYKVPSLNLLLSSRFGILLLVKICIFVIMVASALFVVLVIGPRLKKKKAEPLSDSADLTLQELNAFDGEDGRPAYIAFKGIIYDVSKSKLWRDGNHMKRHKAGTDLTDMLSQAPHREDKVVAMPQIGNLTTKDKIKARSMHEKVFYFMAYMNLGFVCIIALILALWRWL